MSLNLSPALLAQIFAQESEDPFLTLVTLSNPAFASDITLVNNQDNVTSRGIVFEAFPMSLRFPADDGETVREFQIVFDNVGLDLITPLRSVSDDILVKIEMILASMPDVVQIAQEDLKIQTIQYNQSQITARLILDNFLNTEMPSEKYAPSIYRGLF